MDNKYHYLTGSEIEDLFTCCLNYDKRAKTIFLKEIFEQVADNHVLTLWNELCYHDYWNEAKDNKDVFLNFVQRCLNELPAKVIAEYDNYFEFVDLISERKELLGQYFAILFKQDKKKNSPEFNSIMAEIISDTNFMDDNKNFQELFFSYQHIIDIILLEEAITNSSKPLIFYQLLTEENKAKIEKEGKLNSILNSFIEHAKLKDDLATSLKELNLFDKLNTNQMMYCLTHNKPLMNHLFSTDKIKEQLDKNFWDVLLKQAYDEKNNNFKLIKKYLTSEQIIEKLKEHIFENASLGNFYKNNANDNLHFIDSVIHIFNSFEKELNSYFKEKSVKTLEKFITTQSRSILKQMKKDYCDDAEEKLNLFITQTQKKMFDSMMSDENLKTTKKIKI